MSNKPKITLGLPDHPRCQAIIDGKVGIEGYELAVDPNFTTSGERHYKYLHGQWDVGEVSAASLIARHRKEDNELLAIPVFFERGPRQRNIYHCDKYLKHPSELKGKKFGCFRYGATASVWARGYLLDAHNIKNHRHAMVRLRPRSVYRPRTAGESRAYRSAAALWRRETGAFEDVKRRRAARRRRAGRLMVTPGLFGGGETPKMMAAYPA